MKTRRILLVTRLLQQRDNIARASRPPTQSWCSGVFTLSTLARSKSTECVHENWQSNPNKTLQSQEYFVRKEAVGLYGYDLLKTAKGFRVFAQVAIERSEELISHIKQLPPSMDVVWAMDDISNTVCTVVDAAELCRNTHPDKEFVEEANQASMEMYKFLHHLNTNHALYNSIVRLEESNVLTTEEAKRAAKTLRVDFERGGIHLATEKLERLNKLNLEITLLGREYGENILHDQGQIDIFPSSKIPRNLHHMLSPIQRSKSGVPKVTVEARDIEKGWRVITEPGILSSILKWVPDPEVRKQVYIVGNTVPKANLQVLDRLIEARHEFSKLLGYNSYAEFATAMTIAGSPQVVKAFLIELLSKIHTKVEEELMLLKSFKKQMEDGDSTFNAWDEAYYTNLAKSQALNLNARVVASYFPLTQCMEGLKFTVRSLFGATFLQVPVARGETWHSDVQKWALEHPLEGILGYMFLDLYARKGKFPNCAHFTLRGGRRVSPDEYQLPVVALVCNFSSPASAVSVLNHWEVETLFHEFGHALHSLLSRTDYQHFSGTRTLLDFAETPSNLFEYFAWDYRVLKHFAKHHTSGEVIPKKLVESMNNAKKLLAATELQRQVLYSLMDQSLFGEQSYHAKDTTILVSDLKNQYSSLKHVEHTHWHTRFSHLVSYGAGYYSYLYARCFAASIWQKICAKDPLSLQTGDMLRKGFLQHGGAKDPSIMLRDSLGKEALITSVSGGQTPCIDQLLAEYGI
ncbi:hypothetical protein O6H91_02G150900 [Diphasiastrum complanatum]|uniref:Uncharacterized protein n=1 Tax=Diphasiastrum complanatum TaxID=34168 RepID=A0ACC2ELT1_DIPCM|nr:hypothetical protein O6H91_02G150900 [Diphasiastrum complanatum]